jgi:hypothetical protein
MRNYRKPYNLSPYWSEDFNRVNYTRFLSTNYYENALFWSFCLVPLGGTNTLVEKLTRSFPACPIRSNKKAHYKFEDEERQLAFVPNREWYRSAT